MTLDIPHTKNSSVTVQLDGESLTLDLAQKIARGARVEIAEKTKAKILQSRQFVDSVATNEKPIYGVNTGFGFFAKKRIDNGQLKDLQHNLLKSHASGFGTPLSLPETRLAMALRLNVLVKGLTGVRWELCEQLRLLMDAGIFPIIPGKGSVGASGDLAPLAHLALPIIGMGEVSYKGEKMDAATALHQAGIIPLTLEVKEGLSLINGTQIMGAVGGHALSRGKTLFPLSNKIAALTFEAMEGLTDALHLPLHTHRGHIGQVETAKALLAELEGSPIFYENSSHGRVQDPYSLRCIPQIHGPSFEAITYTSSIVEREFNAATDNPLVFTEDELVVSGGNFHGQPLAMAFDFAAIAFSELANVSERRQELLLNPHFSQLGAFLSPQEGLLSGYMASQYLSASLVNENKILSHPASTDSIPGNVGVEDHVSMGMTSARKLRTIVDNLETVLAVEWLFAAQAFDLRGVKPSGKGTTESYKKIRDVVPMLNEDRIVAQDIKRAVSLIREEE